MGLPAGRHALALEARDGAEQHFRVGGGRPVAATEYVAERRPHRVARLDEVAQQPDASNCDDGHSVGEDVAECAAHDTLPFLLVSLAPASKDYRQQGKSEGT